MRKTTRTTVTIMTALFLALALACQGGPGESEPAGRAAAPEAVKAGAPGPAAAARGLDAQGRMQISKGDRCPVCAMVVAEHPKFASAVELDDGTVFHFCGTGCMLKSWLHPEIFLGRDKGTLRRAVTPEYFGGEYVDALTAWWVAGSDVVGPMGPALVPLKDSEDLKTFMKRHGGKTTFRLTGLDDERWEAITGKSATMGPRSKK